MNKFAIYILLILLFLGLSKSFSPTEQKTTYLSNEKVFSSFFHGQPLTVILEDAFTTGLIIKTYFLKFRILHGFKSPESAIIRTSKDFYSKNVPNIGMSVFRRSEKNRTESVLPMPPGLLYIGDPAYGEWRYSNSGDQIWKFYRAYRSFPKIFGWGDFTFSKKFKEEADRFEKAGNPFYGDNKEFGLNGSVTKKSFQSPLFNAPAFQIDLKTHMKKFLQLPFKKKGTTKEEEKQNE